MHISVQHLLLPADLSLEIDAIGVASREFMSDSNQVNCLGSVENLYCGKRKNQRVSTDLDNQCKISQR